ncbi:MAG: DUF3105 domain-containing protein [Actinomycetota bacterium]
MVAKKVDQDRKAKIAELQRQAKAAERRRTLTIIGGAVAVIVLISGAVTFAIISDDSRVPSGALGTIGVTSAQASCDPITTDAAADGGNASVSHIGPGTDKPDVTTIKYDTVPPTSGQHYPFPEFPNREYYTEQDRPKMENLVHNLEHGYTVLWYDKSISEAERAQLKAVAREANSSDQAREKFIVSAWDTAYGTFPSGKRFALSHWSADPQDPKKQSGHRQLCGQISGAAVKDFITAHPRTSAPEPQGQ